MVASYLNSRHRGGRGGAITVAFSVVFAFTFAEPGTFGFSDAYQHTFVPNHSAIDRQCERLSCKHRLELGIREWSHAILDHDLS